MDLITKESAIQAYEDSLHGKGSMYGMINNCPSAFDGLTYGEVMKAVLGIKDEQIIKGEYETVIRLKKDSDAFMSFDSKVWDSPYQKGGM